MRPWLLLLALIGPFAITCCGSDVRRSDDDDGGGEGGSGAFTPSAIDKIDLLLVVDNSRSMADKQQILQLAVPDLVQQLTNPQCVDAGGHPVSQQPFSPLDDCPDPSSEREFAPILDIHIGVITSSLGGHGADSCVAQQDASENDEGHLITRQTTGATPGTVPTYQGLGFLVWDPDSSAPTHAPQGETSPTALNDNLALLVGGAGEVGCGFESTLEAWYRFLVDPDPHETIALENGSAVLQGTDTALLQQRQSFLRPDSLVAIVMLSDENDCSIRDGGQYFFAGQIYAPGTSQHYHLPKPRPECASNPDDSCCRSCGQPQQNCPDASAHCDSDGDGIADPLDGTEDALNLRCYDQKRRFGIDFLYPIDRYLAGLTQAEVPDRGGNLMGNPLFSDLNPEDAISSIRDPSMVFIAGIVGVPWQDVARRNADGAPDLINGCAGDCAQPQNQVGGFQNAGEMFAIGTWDHILGDPSCYATDPNCLPQDALMIESVSPRSGENPVVGDPLAPPSMPHGNSINGNEHDIPLRDDLQYACIFALPTPRDCSTAGMNEYCDCKGMPPDEIDEDPLCWDGSAFTNIQRYAKAYPGTRHLQLLKGAGEQGIVTSICPAQLIDPTLFNFGYRPAVHTVVAAVKGDLRPPSPSR